ncbi:hypothetical protein Ancab_011265 [Ancistrocladus abbreviatus]
MDELPAELIGCLLSKMTPKDAVSASTVCKKWRQALHHVTSMTFCAMSISALNLTHALTQFPNLEKLEMIHVDFEGVNEGTIVLHVPRVKFLHLEAMWNLYVDGISLIGDCLEDITIWGFVLARLEIFGGAMLTNLTIDEPSTLFVEEKLTKLDILNLTGVKIELPMFFDVIQGCSRLSVLRLMDVQILENDSTMHLETVADAFPRLRHLALYGDILAALVLPSSLSSFCMNHVREIEVGSSHIDGAFYASVEELLLKCPQTKRVVMYGTDDALHNFKDELKNKHLNAEIHIAEFLAFLDH